MSDSNKNKKTTLSDFLRYQRDEMSGAERNAFEREMQKDPFAEEAAEGFTLLSTEQYSKDLEDLQKRLATRTLQRQKFMFYRIAASVAALMVISTIFILVERNKTTRQHSETIAQVNPIIIEENKPIREPVVKDIVTEKPVRSQKKSAGKSEREVILNAPAMEEMVSENVDDAAPQKPDSISFQYVKAADVSISSGRLAAPAATMAKEKRASLFSVSGKVISSEDNMPVPGASVFVKGMRTGVVTDAGGNFSITLPDSEKRIFVADFIGMKPKEFEVKKDSQAEVKLDPDLTSLSEVVVVGYGAAKFDAETGDEPAGYIAPKPAVGRSEFDKYIQANIQRPDKSTTGQRVVVVLNFLVRTDGSIDSIKVVRSPGILFSDEAIRLLKSGPSWRPAEENGKPIEDEARIRIVFR